MFIKKNGAVISVIVLLLFVAVYLNWQYGRGIGTDEVIDISEENQILDVSVSNDSERITDGEYVIDIKKEEAQIADSVEDGYIITGARVGELSAYFDETRLGRQQTRDEAINLLQSTIDSEDASGEAKSAAEESIAVLATNAVAESRIESLVMAKGFEECVAIIDDSGVNVIVLPKEEGLEASDVSKIKDIILAQTSVSAEQIRVIEAK